MVRSPKSRKNCLGRRGVLRGQNRVPLPPAMITATASESACSDGPLCPNGIDVTSQTLVTSAGILPIYGVGQLRFTGRDTAAHPAQRQQETDERLGSLVLARALRIEAVGHRARLLIVKGHAQPVLPQKPGEGRPRHLEVAGLLCHLVGRIAGLDQIPRVDGLLAKDRPAFSPFDPALVSNKVKVRAGPGEPEEKVE